MAQVSYSGSFNPSTLNAADVYVNITQADTGSISAARTGYVGLVGVASWGYVGKAVQIGNDRTLNDYGTPVVRTSDLVTHAGVIIAAQQAAGVGTKLYVVRQTDGTDLSAYVTLQGVILTSFHTGTLGNQTIATLQPGSRSTTAAPTWKLTLQLAGRSEVFADIPSGTGLWAAIANAVNNGQGPLRPPSRIATATPVPGYVTAAVPTSVPMMAGTDGAGAVTSSQLVGLDTTAPTGLYALRGLGLSLAVIADFCDDTFMATLAAFGVSEGVYVMASGAPGETPTGAQSELVTYGINSQWLKRFVGDWAYTSDTFNGVLRVLAPSTFGAATLSVLPPSGSGLNKPVLNLISTQQSRASNPYSSTDLATMTSAGLEVICNPIPRGAVFGMRTGQNTSTNTAVNGDNYPLMTSFLARSISTAAALGGLIGQTMTPEFYQQGQDVLDAFMAGLLQDELIEGYSVSFNAGTVTATQAQNGISAAMVIVQYFSISRIILINLNGGQTVVLPPSASPALAA